MRTIWIQLWKAEVGGVRVRGKRRIGCMKEVERALGMRVFSSRARKREWKRQAWMESDSRWVNVGAGLWRCNLTLSCIQREWEREAHCCWRGGGKPINAVEPHCGLYYPGNVQPLARTLVEELGPSTPFVKKKLCEWICGGEGQGICQYWATPPCRAGQWPLSVDGWKTSGQILKSTKWGWGRFKWSKWCIN